MILDPLLVLGVGPFPRLEVVGAAIATVTAQIIVLLILVVEILRDHGEANVLHKIRLLSRPDIACLKGVFRIGTPTALQGSLYCIISMILTRMVSGFGDGAIAVQRVGGQIESLSWNTADGFGSALNAFMGQNYGAGKKGPNQIRIPYFHSASDMLGCTDHYCLCSFFHDRFLCSFSMRRKLSGFPLITCGSSDFPKIFLSVEMMTVGALSGLGRTQLCSLISVGLTVIRIPLALVLSNTALGLNGIWWALTLSTVSKGIIFICIPVYLRTQSVKNYKQIMKKIRQMIFSQHLPGLII